MGTHIIKMPDIGEGIAEVELVAWHVKVGDAVVEDQILADVMTDKATVEIPSSVHGTVLALGGAVGQSMAVGSELIRIEVEGAGNVKGGDSAQKVPTAPVESAQVAPVSIASAPPKAVSAEPVEAPKQAQSARAGASQASHHRAPDDKPLASPAVRRRAWELGIALQFVPGTGMGGRITRDDLEGYASGLAERGAAVVPQGAQRYALRVGEETEPVIGLRRKIAQKMQESKRRIPHFAYVEEVDVTELEDLRQRLNARYDGQRPRLTLLPFIVRAMVLALPQFPHINARYDDEAAQLTRYRPVHLGIATQTASGLMVPVIRNAEALDPWACANEITRLADAARSGKATRDELSGSTITLTSLGALGGIVSTPVINHPEVAIVGVNRMVERPVIRQGAVVARRMMNLSSSFDHRVVDGMHAAEFIQAVRGLLEFPATLFVE